MTPDRRLASHVAGLGFEVLSQAAILRAETFVLDGIGVGLGLAGGSVAQTVPLLEAVRGWGDGAALDVWGRSERLPAGAAVLLDAYQGNASGSIACERAR